VDERGRGERVESRNQEVPERLGMSEKKGGIGRWAGTATLPPVESRRYAV
jgi:hypothetical protein